VLFKVPYVAYVKDGVRRTGVRNIDPNGSSSYDPQQRWNPEDVIFDTDAKTQLFPAVEQTIFSCAVIVLRLVWRAPTAIVAMSARASF